jgi:hypothetical protein
MTELPSGWVRRYPMDVLGAVSGQPLYHRMVIPATQTQEVEFQIPPNAETVLSYWVEGLSGGTAQIDTQERWQHGVRTNRYECGPFGGGDVLLSGAVRVSVTASSHGQVIICWALHPGHEGPEEIPPISSTITCPTPGAPGAPGAFVTIGPYNGWCPARRCKLNVLAEGELVMRLLDPAGATVATMQVPDPAGGTINILHPPIYRLQFAHNGDGPLVNRVVVCTWLRS